MEIIKVRKNQKEMEVALGIKGLVSEGEEVRQALERLKPKLILMGISPEEAEGLQGFVNDPFEIQMSDFELMYGALLLKFGEVETPPPIFTQTVLYARDHDVPVIGIDVDEETFGQHYDEEYTVSQMVGYITKKRKLKRKTFNLETPQAFVMHWKSEIEKTRAMNNMERLREEAIVSGLESEFLKSDESPVFAIIEYEFNEAVREKINSI
jgi:hypothetical protein